MPGFVLLWVWLAGADWGGLRRWVALGCAAYLGLMLAVAPWTYRNWTVLHAFVPVSTNGGWTLLTGNNPEANGDYTPQTQLAQGIDHDPADQVATDRLSRERAVAWIRANQARFVELLPLKTVHLWGPDGEAEWFYQRGFAGYERWAPVFRAVRVLNQGYYVLMLLFAAPSMWLLLRGRGPTDWAHAGLALCVAFTLISLLFSGQSRFHFSLMPFLAAYAAWSVVRLAERRAVGFYGGGAQPPGRWKTQV